MSIRRRVTQCKDPINLEKNLILGIHSNVSGGNVEYTDGHTWATVYESYRILFLGLWPDAHYAATKKDPRSFLETLEQVSPSTIDTPRLDRSLSDNHALMNDRFKSQKSF